MSIFPTTGGTGGTVTTTGWIYRPQDITDASRQTTFVPSVLPAPAVSAPRNDLAIRKAALDYALQILEPTPITIAAIFGLVKTIETYLRTGYFVEEKQQEKTTNVLGE